MTDLNLFCLTGRVVKKPELTVKVRDTGDLKTASFSLAVNRSIKQKSGGWIDKTSFFDFTVFGKMAEFCEKWLDKGQKISVRGHMEQAIWEKDGHRKSRVCFRAEEINPFLGRSENIIRQEKESAGIPEDVFETEEDEEQEEEFYIEENFDTEAHDEDNDGNKS